MTKNDFLNFKKQLKKLIDKAEDEALEEGVNITSVEFQEVLAMIENKLLKKYNMTKAEFNELSQEIENTENEVGQDIATLASAHTLLSKTKKSQDKIYQDIEKVKQEINTVKQKQLTEQDVSKLIPEAPKIKDYTKDIDRIEKTKLELMSGLTPLKFQNR